MLTPRSPSAVVIRSCVSGRPRVLPEIFVASEVMDTAGIIPDADEIGEEKDKSEPIVDEERLAVFRDFVNSLDLPELPDEPGAKDEPGAQDRPGGRPGRG